MARSIHSSRIRALSGRSRIAAKYRVIFTPSAYQITRRFGSPHNGVLEPTPRSAATRDPTASAAPLLGGRLQALVGRQRQNHTRRYGRKRYTGLWRWETKKPMRRAPHSAEAKRCRRNARRTGLPLDGRTSSRQMHQPPMHVHADRLLRYTAPTLPFKPLSILPPNVCVDRRREPRSAERRPSRTHR